ncbi:hypothetical protein GMJAKD_02790 [Candidatus Electrothrix aarhusensis]
MLLYLGCHAGTVIRYTDTNGFRPHLFATQGYPTAAPSTFRQSIYSVRDDIKKNLQEFSVIAPRTPDILIKNKFHADLVIRCLFGEEINRLIQEGVDINLFHFHLGLMGKTEQTMSNDLTALHAILDACKGFLHHILVRKIRRHLLNILDQASLLINDRQGIINFMGHPGCQPADGGQLIGLLGPGQKLLAL